MYKLQTAFMRILFPFQGNLDPIIADKEIWDVMIISVYVQLYLYKIKIKKHGLSNKFKSIILIF